METENLKSMTNLWRGNQETRKLEFRRSLNFSIATYMSETWSMDKETEQKINVFEMRCYRKILRIQWTEKRNNVSILEQLGNIPEKWLLDSIMRQIDFFGHTKIHYSIERDIYEGIIEGRRERGRP